MSTGSKAGDIILNHVCPALGVMFANYQNIAPLKDLDHAVKKGQGLNGLNPTPWIFMLGTTLAWTAYALLSNDYYLFFADCFGFLSCIWLNLGAVKLMYSDHHQLQTRKALVAHLQKSHMESEQEKKSIMIQNAKEKDEMRRTFARETLAIRMSSLEDYDHSDESELDKSSEEKRSTALEVDDGKDNEERSSKVRFSMVPPRRSTAFKSNNGKDNEERSSKVRFSSRFPRRSTTFAMNDEDNERNSSAGDPDSSNRSSETSMRFSSIFPRRMSLMSNSSAGDPDNSNRSSTAPRRRFSGFLHTGMSLKKIGSQSSLERKENITKWADDVWKITAQQEPAGASHEKLLIGTISFWLVVISILFFYSFHDPREDRNYIPLQVIGYIGIANQLFFYGAPLARIGQVLKTKRCDCIHMHSLIGNTLNNSLWTGYGLAPDIKDPFIWGPCAVGLCFCAIQYLLCAIFPRSTESEKVAKRFSITSLLVPESELGVAVVRPSSTLGKDPAISEALKIIREEYESGELGLADLESQFGGTIEEEDEEEGSEYMTSFGNFSYLY